MPRPVRGHRGSSTSPVPGLRDDVSALLVHVRVHLEPGVLRGSESRQLVPERVGYLEARQGQGLCDTIW